MIVVVHMAPYSPSVLPSILARRGNFAASHPHDRERLFSGHIYIAPPDKHVYVSGDRIRVVRGPKENGHRPAVDPLFRSAATEYGDRVLGIVLSGALDDGAAGLLAIKQAGGYVVAQSDALHTSMPDSARAAVELDAWATIDEIRELIEDPPDAKGGSQAMPRSKEEMPDEFTVEPNQGEPSVFTCPECGGTLWELPEDAVVRFRCRVGHGYTLESMMAVHSESLESSLWAAVRALDERAALLERTAERMEKRRAGRGARFKRQARDTIEQAKRVREVLLRVHDGPEVVEEQSD
jgi:two-component system chemotaxis response regulator CheB